MNRFGLKAFGLVLCVMGVFFYTQHQGIDTIFVTSRNDFKHLYLAGYLAGRGGDFYNPELMFLSANQLLSDGSGQPVPINPFVYPPFFALLLIPLAWLPYHAAWLVFNLAAHAAFLLSLAIVIHCLRDENEPQSFWWGALLLFSAVFFPLQRSYWAGQMNPFLLLVLMLALRALIQGRETGAGVWLGLGAAVKVSPAFLLLYLLWKGKWKGFFMGMLTLAATGAISIAVLGVTPHLEFLHEARAMGYGSSTWAAYGAHFHVEPHNQAPSAVWYRLLTHNPSTTGVIDSPAMAKAASYLTAALIAASLLGMTRRRSDELLPWEFSLWTIAMLLLPSLMWDHYLVQAFFAMALGLRVVFSGRARFVWVYGLGLILMMTPFNYWSGAFTTGWMTLLLNEKLAGLLMLTLFLIVNPFSLQHNENDA
ncbi:MAG: DUF2029 domain-containing protein [bacterium]|nr:DUF2029 domain-containing protein [bacterium]